MQSSVTSVSGSGKPGGRPGAVTGSWRSMRAATSWLRARKSSLGLKPLPASLRQKAQFLQTTAAVFWQTPGTPVQALFIHPAGQTGPSGIRSGYPTVAVLLPETDQLGELRLPKPVQHFHPSQE